MKSIIIFLFSAGLIACKESKNKDGETETTIVPPIKHTVFDRMPGTWQNEDGKNFERWSVNNDGSYRSVAYSIKGSDTSWNEEAHIYRENDQWIFENIVKGQNEGKAVKFTSTILNENTVQFSNPAHDFPTDVNYTLVNNDTLRAFIVGPAEKGGKDTIPFAYTRVK